MGWVRKLQCQPPASPNSPLAARSPTVLSHSSSTTRRINKLDHTIAFIMKLVYTTPFSRELYHPFLFTKAIRSANLVALSSFEQSTILSTSSRTLCLLTPD